MVGGWDLKMITQDGFVRQNSVAPRQVDLWQAVSASRFVWQVESRQVGQRVPPLLWPLSVILTQALMISVVSRKTK